MYRKSHTHGLVVVAFVVVIVTVSAGSKAHAAAAYRDTIAACLGSPSTAFTEQGSMVCDINTNLKVCDPPLSSRQIDNTNTGNCGVVVTVDAADELTGTRRCSQRH